MRPLHAQTINNILPSAKGGCECHKMYCIRHYALNFTQMGEILPESTNMSNKKKSLKTKMI